VKSTVDHLEDNKVRLSIEVDEAELEPAIDAAFRRMARDLRVPGFRPGKVPRRLIEARIGTEAARQEALREALPGYYRQVLGEHDLQPVAPPDVDIHAGELEGPVAFDVVVEIMPRVGVGGYEGLRVVLPSIQVVPAEVDEQLDRVRAQHATLAPVARPARDGDHVSLDRRVTRHDEVLQVAEDELYEVGSGGVAPELDDLLRGARAGDILQANATIPSEGEVTIRVLVKDVSEQVLPELTDDWAAEASEYDTVAELRADVTRRLDAVKRLQAAMAVRDRVLEALGELVTEPLPESLVAREMDRRLEDLEHRLSHRGGDVAQYLAATGQTQEELLGALRAQVEEGLRSDLALASVAELEGIGVSEEELEAEIAQIASRRGERPAATRRHLDDEGDLPTLRSSIRRSKALEWLVEHTELVDDEGRVIDRADLEPERIQAAVGPPEPQSEAPAPAPGGGEQTDPPTPAPRPAEAEATSE